jgi:small subunit ribosomal protein S21
MIIVTLKEKESIDSALRRFNAAVASDGILKKVKEKSSYEKPSVKRRRLQKQRRSESRLNS